MNNLDGFVDFLNLTGPRFYTVPRHFIGHVSQEAKDKGWLTPPKPCAYCGREVAPHEPCKNCGARP